MALQDQVNALLAAQGRTAAEDELLNSRVRIYGAMASSPGANATFGVLLDSGTEAFHKTFSGVNVPTAMAYGHHPDQVPINECAAWRLAAVMGGQLADLVTPCVLWTYNGEPGSLSRRLEGINQTTHPFGSAPAQCQAAAFFDSLVAQQDRHLGNLRWDAAAFRLGLYDHGYAFALPGRYLNASVFVDWRHGQGQQQLEQWERDALDQLLGSGDLLGLRDMLASDRADGLEDRAQRMRQADEVLPAGQF